LKRVLWCIHSNKREKVTMLVENFKVDSSNVVYGESSIESRYEYQHTEVVQQPGNGGLIVKPVKTAYEFKTDTRVPKLGCVYYVLI